MKRTEGKITEVSKQEINEAIAANNHELVAEMLEGFDFVKDEPPHPFRRTTTSYRGKRIDCGNNRCRKRRSCRRRCGHHHQLSDDLSRLFSFSARFQSLSSGHTDGHTEY